MPRSAPLSTPGRPRPLRLLPAFLARTAVVACGLLLALPAAGQQEHNPASPWYRADSDRRWHFDGFLGAEIEPDYPGADDYEAEPGALLRVILKDRWDNRYQLGLGEVVGVFDLSPAWSFAAKLEYEEGREVESPDLAGFEEGEDTVEGEFTLLRRFGPWTGAAVFQPDLLGRGKGIVWFLGLGYDPRVSERFRVGFRADVSWGDDEHMQTEFGVTPDQAAASGLPEYTPGGGLKSTTAGVSFQWYWAGPGERRGGRWSLLGSLELEHYFGKAADSPLIDRLGSDLNYESSLGVLYSF